ncbi:gamma-glutamyl-gamma-aminobutyrate hydrolase family protein [Pseudomonas juntendi]|uniref:gamma-glutamyl-gamma-aminobutyrate hydrolase family protein n=1 Tax=Pseudomonas TaxID=286 RepID=UPI000D90B5AA|nr:MULTISPECIES: gamma-glutamyl-gamma-aminobutyrate hydrolase family protein [Pseudomonas]MBH3383448.1 gamma-glutamyl-gamma-aminobutyrate hydrolase family protein [Pseudomonas juntendi]PYB96488.1 gamma-glutamyl-gamma-aminobutyrate hydrolase [Pseudomonas sp. MB-090624]
MPRVPVIGITACTTLSGQHATQTIAEKYARAAAKAACGLPIVIPSLGELLDSADILAVVDGLIFTGSPSNIEPFHYHGAASAEGTQHDPLRDATTLPLMRAAIAAGVPVLGICRGFQEMNVALGGTLHQNVHEAGAFMDHREGAGEPIDKQYGPRHTMHVQPGGLLERLGLPAVFEVNSIHGQGIDVLAPGLRVEALAPDGLVEAISLDNGQGFSLAVQWHPEYQVMDNPQYLTLFQAFGAACRQRSLLRQNRKQPTAQRACAT